MGAKIIKKEQEAWDALAKGLEQVAEAVGSTLGPNGNNFVLEKKMGITNNNK